MLRAEVDVKRKDYDVARMWAPNLPFFVGVCVVPRGVGSLSSSVVICIML